MKKLIISGVVFLGWLCSAARGWSQNISPRGWSQWTARNWAGFILEILVFILVLIGIYKMALSGEDEDEEKSRNAKENEEDKISH